MAASALSSMMQNGSVSEPKEEHLAPPPPPPPEQPASPPPSQQPTASLTNGVLLDATFSSDRPSGDEGEEGDEEEGGPSPVPVGREGSGGRGSQQKGRSSRKASRVVQSHHPRRTTNRSSVLLKTEQQQQQQQQHGGGATTTSTPVATILKKVDTISPRPHPSLRKRAGSSSSLYDDLMSSTSPSSDIVHVSGGVVGSRPHHQRCRVTSSSVPVPAVWRTSR